jgi:LPXTG-motif cell wall-anchored protein
VSEFLDRIVTPGTGNFAVNALGLAIAIAFAGFLYRRKIFIRV